MAVGIFLQMTGNAPALVVYGLAMVRHVYDEGFFIPESFDNLIDNVIIVIERVVVLGDNLPEALANL